MVLEALSSQVPQHKVEERSICHPTHPPLDCPAEMSGKWCIIRGKVAWVLPGLCLCERVRADLPLPPAPGTSTWSRDTTA